jgi:hypothetical protein
MTAQPCWKKRGVVQPNNKTRKEKTWPSFFCQYAHPIWNIVGKLYQLSLRLAATLFFSLYVIAGFCKSHKSKDCGVSWVDQLQCDGSLKEGLIHGSRRRFTDFHQSSFPSAPPSVNNSCSSAQLSSLLG